MKKIILACAAILAAAIAAASWSLGRAAGIRHAIEDSVIFTVERYDPDDPDATTRDDGADQTIYIVLDEKEYEHGMYQG